MAFILSEDGSEYDPTNPDMVLLSYDEETESITAQTQGATLKWTYGQYCSVVVSMMQYARIITLHRELKAAGLLDEAREALKRHEKKEKPSDGLGFGKPVKGEDKDGS